MYNKEDYRGHLYLFRFIFHVSGSYQMPVFCLVPEERSMTEVEAALLVLNIDRKRYNVGDHMNTDNGYWT